MPRLRLLHALPLLIATAFPACSVDVQGNDTAVHEEKRFTVSDKEPVELRLRTFDGAIQVRSWDKNEVLVEIVRRGPDKASAEALTVNATQDGNKIVIDAPQAGDRQHHVMVFGWVSRGVQLTVTAPKRLVLEARTGDGLIDASDLQGSLDVSSGDGRILLSHIDGKVKAHTGDGSIHADEVSGDIDADSGDGSIEIAGKLSGLNVRTGDGAVQVEALGGSAMKTDWRLTTGDGRIVLRVPDAFGAQVDASTGDGRVRIEGLSHSTSSEDESDRRAVRGTLGSGGQKLLLRSGDGSITVSR